MKIKDIVMEDFVNYKEPSMYIITTQCSFKCCEEIGKNMCQNMDIVKQPTKDIANNVIINAYLSNPITKAVVIAGLEPLDTWSDTLGFIKDFRNKCDDPIIIYTGFYKDEVPEKLEDLRGIDNIIIKWGRYRPDGTPHFDEVLGVNLVNKEQYAERIS